MTGHVRIVEVGPRDGLQNEPRLIATSDKIKFINLLSRAGFTNIEATSFVSPEKVPQMADGEGVLAGISRMSGVRYSALAPNLEGYDRAAASNVDEIAIFASASETFSLKNINCSISESLERFRPVINAARRDAVPVRGYISCAVACPYEGPVKPQNVAALSDTLLELGCYEISLGDTIGAGTPDTVSALLRSVLRSTSIDHIAGHFHDTGGMALTNVGTSLDLGVKVFDAAAGGLGGCPFAPGAKGNLATGELVTLLHDMGFETGINVKRLTAAEAFAHQLTNGDHHER
jgi:hydroxymethylglutaryl-CoA lyase